MFRRVSLLTLALLVAACGSPDWHSDRLEAVPPDFSLELTVLAEGPSSSDPLRRPSQYVLESDRTLRVALGPGSDRVTYPPPTATLSPAQVEELYRLIRRHGLLDAPATPDSPESGPVTYRVVITANGRRHRYSTTPQASPGARALLGRLVELRGGLLPGPSGL